MYFAKVFLSGAEDTCLLSLLYRVHRLSHSSCCPGTTRPARAEWPLSFPYPRRIQRAGTCKVGETGVRLSRRYMYRYNQRVVC